MRQISVDMQLSSSVPLYPVNHTLFGIDAVPQHPSFLQLMIHTDQAPFFIYFNLKYLLQISPTKQHFLVD